MRCDACRCNGAWGGVFVSPAPAYADGYVDGTGNNIYYGFKTDASYSEARFHIEVDYYDTLAHAKAGEEKGKDPLGKFVRVHYLSNCNKDGGTADDWRFRPMWWFGVPKGLQNVQDITYTRVEKLTQNGKKQPFTPAGSSQFKFTNTDGYSQVSQKKYNKPEEWNNISNFYFKDSKVLASKGWKQLLGLNGGKYDTVGNTETQWQDYQNETAGLQGIFVDWESAGQRFYDMTYVGEMTDDAWKKRDENPLRFAAGVYRFAGNWHYAVGQKHNTPKIADHMKVQYPTQTLVKDKTKLEPDEKTKVQNAIYDANKDATPHFKDLLDGAANITVGEDGTATLKFKDNTILTMPGDLLVMEQKRDRDLYPPTYPAPVPAVKPESPNKDEKDAIIKAIKDANKDNKNFTDHVNLDDAGTFTFDDSGKQLKIKYKDTSELTIPYNQLVYQGATIADWAPYVVPDYTEVDSLTSIKPQEITSIKAKFDDANKDLDVYNKAKAKNKDDYLTINASTGDATIKWEDGSKTVIGAWQFLKERAKAPAPEPSTPVAEEKTFTVDVPATPSDTPLDFFNKNASIPPQAISSYQTSLLSKKAYDTKTGAEVKLKSAKFNFANGTIDFSVEGYKDKSYPISLFYRKTTDSKPTKGTGNNGVYTYNLTPVIADIPSKPTNEEKQKALAQFVKDNYNKTISGVTSYTLTDSDNPASGTNYMWKYKQVADGHNGTGVVSIKINDDGSLTVKGMENNVENEHYIDVPVSKLYANPERDRLLAKAKELWNSRDNSLNQKDLNKAGINDKISDLPNSLDNKTTSDLRNFIKNLINAKHIERKYNPIPEIEVANPAAPTDEDFKKAIKAFLDANYTGVGDVNSVPYTVPSALKPKSSTADMEPYDVTKNPVGITTISKGTGNKLTVACKDGTSFTVDITFKKKQDTPAGNDLEKLKEQAKELIERNPKLTEDQKKSFEQQIKDAKTKKEIQNILKKANGQAGQNNVTTQQLKEKEKREEEKRKEEKRKEEEKKQLQKDKDKAKETINSLTNLTDGDSGDKNKLSGEIDNAQTPEEVKNILEKAKAINDARGALKEGALPFLSHGKSDSNDDKALKKLIGADITKKDETLTALETAIKDISNAQTSAIRAALDAATRKNGINEQAARQAANAKIAEFENKLTAAEKVLNDNTTIKDADKNAATSAINDAKAAITTAKTQVASATKPSGMLTQLSNVETKFKDADSKVNDAVNNAQKENKKQNTNDSADELAKEKQEQINLINKSDLPEDKKQEAIGKIKDAKKIGDPTAIANRYLKAKKIDEALKKIDEFTHLNNAQKEAFKKIIEDTDASDHKNADGETSDDIDDALNNAAVTDAAMERLGKLKEIADKFKADNNGKYKNLGTSVDDVAKKTAFDNALTAATNVLKPATGTDKGAPEVNDMYNKLLEAMKAINPSAEGVTVDASDLQKEVNSATSVKESDAYKFATNKSDYDTALTEANTVLNNAKDTSGKTNEQLTDLQRSINDALRKLVAAKNALDGHAPTPTPAPSVDKSHLQQGINGSGDVHNSDDYNNAPSDKKQAYDHALDHANEVNNNPNATQDQVNQATEDLKKAENDLKPAPTPSVDKSGLQKEIGNEPNVKNSDDYNNAPSDKKQAYDHALDHANEVNKDPNATQDQVNQAAEDLKKAENDLKPTPTPSVDKSHLQQGINGSGDVKKSDDYNNAPSDKKQAYDHALDHANEVNKDPNATQDQVNQAAEDLKNAQKDLHDSATVDKSHLQSEVSDDVAFRDRGSYLVADAPHKDAYNAALSEARRVLADPNATQAQVNAALSKLREAKRNILQANGLSGDEYAGDGNTGTGNTGSETGTGNAGTGAVPGGSSVVPGTVPGSGDSGFGSTGTSNAGTSNTGTTNSGVAGSGHEGDSSLGFGVNDNAPTTVDKGELNLQIQGAESDSQSANAGSNNAANAGNAGANNAANAGNAGANAGNAGANNAANAGNAGNAAANNNAAVTAAVENNPAVKQADAQVAAAQAALDSALAEAKKVAADHNATQAQVDAAKRKLADARKNLADAQAHAAQVRASVRAQVLKSGKVAQLSNTGSAVSALSTFAATIAAAGAALFVSKRRGTSRHSSK